MLKIVLVLLCITSLSLALFISNEKEFTSLPNGEGQFKSRICIFIETNICDKEIGTVYLNLAETLAIDGHEVTILLTEKAEDQSVFLPALLAGAKLQIVPKLSIQNGFTPEQTWRSYEIYEFLKHERFDVIHFPDWKGSAYYCVLAKHQGLAFDHTYLVVGAQAPFVWSKLNNFERVRDTVDLEIDFMQRQSVELADIVISPSQFMLNWMIENGWKLPEKSYVQENIITERELKMLSNNNNHNKDSKTINKINEIVFYGDLMPCQGLILFCDALDRLSRSYELQNLEELTPKIPITFLGAPKDVQGINAEEYLSIRGRRWSKFFEYKINTPATTNEALRYLLTKDKLAVVAPETANSPLSIQRLLIAGIPFIASDVGGISELISEESQDSVLFSPRFDKLSSKLFDVITNGIEIAKSAECPMQNIKQWNNWHSNLRVVILDEVRVNPLSPLPLVSVVITHFNRPEYLRQALSSIEKQDYPNFEVILVDDASTKPEAKQEIENLKPIFATRGWKIIVHEENSYLGKARNTGVENSKGEYILFLDDDNVARPNEISVFVKAALHGGADILTSVMDFFSGDEAPEEDSIPSKRRVPLGGDVATGFFWNCFGDANSFVKKSSFIAMGGFTEDYQVGYEDYEYFAKAVLKGFKLEVVPEPLFWYRRAYDTMSFNTPLYKNRMRYIRPYLEHLPSSLSNLFLYVQSMHYEQEQPYMGPSQGGCEFFKACNICLLAGCGWCETSRLCLDGTTNSSANGNCTVENGWVFGDSANCSSCGAQSDCEMCSKTPGCGWCSSDKTCLAASANNTAYWMESACHTSDSKFVTSSHGSCSSKSNKTKIIIIVVASVGGVLLIAAAAALVGFFLYQRNARHRGYVAINQG